MNARTFGRVTPFVRRRPPRSAPTPRRFSPTGKAHGTILMIHGGGWLATTPEHHDALEAAGENLASWGWAAIALTLRPGRAGILDVAAIIDIDDDGPVVLYGESSGGHLALLTAADHPGLVDAAITAASPTTLSALPGRGRFVRGAALRPDDAENLAEFSPLERASDIAAPVFMTYATNDPLVAPAHAELFARAHPQTTLVELPAGEARWQHSHVDEGAVRAAAEQLREWLIDVQATSRTDRP